MISAVIRYRVPVVVFHRHEKLHGTLTVARRVDGKFWDSNLYVGPKLWVATEQPATPKNGGFFGMSDQTFLFHVRAVIIEVERVRFDFGNTDFLPLTAEIIDLADRRRKAVH
jgi:hypothetical protein